MLTAFITSFNMFLDALFDIDLQDLCKCLLLPHKDKLSLMLNPFGCLLWLLQMVRKSLCSNSMQSFFSVFRSDVLKCFTII